MTHIELDGVDFLKRIEIALRNLVVSRVHVNHLGWRPSLLGGAIAARPEAVARRTEMAGGHRS